MSDAPLRDQLWTVLVKLKTREDFEDAQFLFKEAYEKLRKTAFKTFEVGDNVAVVDPRTGEEILGVITGKGTKYLYVTMRGKEYSASAMVVRKVD